MVSVHFDREDEAVRSALTVLGKAGDEVQRREVDADELGVLVISN